MTAPQCAPAPHPVVTFAVVLEARPWQDGFYLDIAHRLCRLFVKTRYTAFEAGDNLTISYLPDGQFSDFRIIQRNTHNVSPAILAFEWVGLPQISKEETTMPLPANIPANLDLAASNHPLTMSSQEIADLVQKRHDNVKRTIETLAENGVIRLPQIEDSEIINNLGLRQPVKLYVFTGERGKRDSLVVVAQLCPEFTAKIVDRWQELESQHQKPVLPGNYLEALKALTAEVETRIALEHKTGELEAKVEEQAPKVAALERIEASPEHITITQAAKTIGVKRDRLTELMHRSGWVYRQNGSWVAYESVIRQGLMVYKEARYTDEKTGAECVKPYAHLTQKGMTKLAAIA